MTGPHDRFVRFTFGHPERAAAELRAALPAPVVSEVDWSTLRREPGSVVDPELRGTESDLLFTARLRDGGPVLLYVLLEHQLDDLTTERAEALMARPGPPLVRLALLALRFGRTEELAWRLPEWTALFAELAIHPGAADELAALVRYLFQVGGRDIQAAVSRVLASTLDARRAKELMKTYG